MQDIKVLLNNMTIEEKIGQLMQYNADLFMDTDADVTGPMAQLGICEEDLKSVGSVLNFKNSCEMRAIQEKHLKNDRNKIPMLFMMDVIHGYRTIYPIPLALGCSFDPGLVEHCSRMASREAVKGGVHVTFAPMVDYVRDARWGRVMESCGEDAMLNGIMGAAQVKGFQGDDLSDKTNIAACVKHFAAYGGADAGRDYNNVELSEHILREHYLPAYKACIDAGVSMLMPSFNVLNGVPSIANSWLMKKILKDEWNFNGVVISDYDAVKELCTHGIACDGSEAARLVFENGCDIEMCSTTYLEHLKELINEGVFSEQKLDEAVGRVLELKNKLGLFEDPYRGASQTEESEVFLTSQNRKTARSAAEECAVLLKNNGILPLSENISKIALIGPFADSKEILGPWSCNGRNEESVTIKEGITALLPKAQITTVAGCSCELGDFDNSGFDEAISAAKDAQIVILCLGEHQEQSGEGKSRADITLPGVQNELAEAVATVNQNTVAVTFSGRPLNLTKLDKAVPAILHMWFPGTEGGNAAARLLFGKANPSGKLSMSFPKTVGQCPIYYNHTNTGRPKLGPDDVCVPYCSGYIDCGNLPLYSFGHGLSYSNFVYEEMKISSNEMTRDESIEVSITVYNDSDIEGEETIMLYMRDMFASTARPVQQLIAFEKAEFKANERKTIKFSINEHMLRFWNNENKYVSEPGEFMLYTGYADHLIFSQSFRLNN